MTTQSDLPAVTVTPCPDGPLIVRGDVRFLAPDGTEIPRHRRTVALCRCGRSGIAPWCDGTHKVIGFTTSDPDPDPGGSDGDDDGHGGEAR